MILEWIFCKHSMLAWLLRHFGKILQIDLRHMIMLVGCIRKVVPDPNSSQAIASGSRFIPLNSKALLVLKSSLFMSRYPQAAKHPKHLSTNTSPRLLDMALARVGWPLNHRKSRERIYVLCDFAQALLTAFDESFLLAHLLHDANSLLLLKWIQLATTRYKWKEAFGVDMPRGSSKV